jgi:hypothetical protein
MATPLNGLGSSKIPITGFFLTLGGKHPSLHTINKKKEGRRFGIKYWMRKRPSKTAPKICSF